MKSDICDMTTFPGFGSRRSVETVDAGDLSKEDFVKEYWKTNKPLLIKGAIKHWPALQQWRDPVNMKELLGNEEVTVRRRPWSVDGSWTPEDMKARLMFNQQRNLRMKFHEFLDEWNSRDGRSLTLAMLSFSLNPEQNFDFEKFSKIHKLSPAFLDSLCRFASDSMTSFTLNQGLGEAKMYAPWRLLMFKGGFTDWHAHPIDSTFMCQIKGRKQALLLPPNAGVKAIRPVLTKYHYSFEASAGEFPDYDSCEPYHVVVKPGDAFHIPVYWQHTVQPMTEENGITAIHAFANPWHVSGDHRFILSHEFMKRAPQPLAEKVREYFDASLQRPREEVFIA